MRALDLVRFLSTSATTRTAPDTPTALRARLAGGAARALEAGRKVRTEVPRELRERTTEASLAAFLTAYVDDRESGATEGGRHALRYALHHPSATLGAVAAVLRLPVAPRRWGTDRPVRSSAPRCWPATSVG